MNISHSQHKQRKFCQWHFAALVGVWGFDRTRQLLEKDSRTHQFWTIKSKNPMFGSSRKLREYLKRFLKKNRNSSIQNPCAAPVLWYDYRNWKCDGTKLMQAERLTDVNIEIVMPLDLLMWWKTKVYHTIIRSHIWKDIHTWILK